MVAALAGQKANAEPRVFTTSFEEVSDFQGFYIVPQNHKGTASHDLTNENAHSGEFSHKGWVSDANNASSFGINNNHRAYPTVQLYKLPKRAFKTPVDIEFWVWLDMELKKGEWFSFATLDHTTSNKWDPVLVNLSDEGYVHLMHVPTNGLGKRTFQTGDVRFPMRQWVRLNIELHFDKYEGYAEVRQDGILVSKSEIRRGSGLFTQAHFGLYAPPSVKTGVVYNDDLVIRELARN